MKASEVNQIDTKWLFFKKGACSQTLFYILNREFGQPREAEERAIDALVGGIMQQGFQCGLLWGATMAIGAESYRRHQDLARAMYITIRATQHVMESFTKRAKSVDCYDITKADFSNKVSFAKYMVTGKFLSCFKLADRWAPEAIKAAREGLEIEPTNIPPLPISCASEVARKMGASEEHMLMVTGFAGGMGLSGNACGALSAAIWLNSLEWDKIRPKKSPYPNPMADKTLAAFFAETDYEFQCSKICGARFNSIKEHAEFIKNGGCEKLINVLAQTNILSEN